MFYRLHEVVQHMELYHFMYVYVCVHRSGCHELRDYDIDYCICVYVYR